MGDFLMPSLGADMDAGTLVEWKVKPGDRVKRGDLVAVVETVKGAIDIEVWETGVVKELLVQPGTVVPVGTVLARIETEGGPAAVSAPGAPAPLRAPAPAQVAAVAAVSPPVPAAERPERHRRISPRARRLAEETGVDLAALEAGVITGDDVLKAAKKPAPTMRDAIAKAMARSKREIPHYYLETHVDLGAALAWLEAANAKRPVSDRLLPAALLLKATALGLREVPELNGFFRDGAFARADAVHLGVAISLKGGGLVAPAIHDADRLSVGELMAKLMDLVTRARSGGLRSSEMSDATVTVTNLGDLGADGVWGVIYPPQVAIIGFGKIAQRPWVRDGRVEARPVVTATLAADHRVSDGHRGGLFLAALDRLLQDPEKL